MDFMFFNIYQIFFFGKLVYCILNMMLLYIYRERVIYDIDGWDKIRIEQ